MSIFVIGVNHKTAPILVREKVFFAQEKLAIYLQDLLNQGYTEEAVILSTCNRSEIYFEAEDASGLCEWFFENTVIDRDVLTNCLYIYQDHAAVSHIMAVACGLDSMILGESQILGQLKDAFSESCSVGAVGSIFHQLFKYVFSIAKEVRSTTAIGACPVSVASAAVRFASQQLSAFSNATVLLIGAGDTSLLLIRYLEGLLKKPLHIINRCLKKATAISPLDAKIYELSEMAEALKAADVIFSATGSALPIITKAMVQAAQSSRQFKPLLLIDIAVPRDIDSSVSEIPGVTLFCIDDLKNLIEDNLRNREHAALKAQECIRKHSDEFILVYQSLEKVTTTIKAYRNQIESICQVELSKAKKRLQDGNDPHVVMDRFAIALTKKLLHTPSVQLRQAGVEGRLELLHLAKQLFAIQDHELEIKQS